MRQADRAKQFLPFDALKGFFSMVDNAEKEVCPRKYLDGFGQELLDKKINQLKKGILVTIVHYLDDGYIRTTGMVSNIDEFNQSVTLVKNKIYFKDIYDIIGDDIKVDFYNDI